MTNNVQFGKVSLTPHSYWLFMYLQAVCCSWTRGCCKVMNAMRRRLPWRSVNLNLFVVVQANPFEKLAFTLNSPILQRDPAFTISAEDGAGFRWWRRFACLLGIGNRPAEGYRYDNSAWQAGYRWHSRGLAGSLCQPPIDRGKFHPARPWHRHENTDEMLHCCPLCLGQTCEYVKSLQFWQQVRSAWGTAELRLRLCAPNLQRLWELESWGKIQASFYRESFF